MKHSSMIARLGPNMENFYPLLEEYMEHYEQAKPIFTFKGKTLDTALREQAAYPVFYDEKRAELKVLVDYLEKQVEIVRGKKTRKLIEGYSREISDRVRDKLVDTDPDFQAMNDFLLEAREVYDKYTGIMESFKLRGFALRDMTTARVNKIESGLV